MAFRPQEVKLGTVNVNGFAGDAERFDRVGRTGIQVEVFLVGADVAIGPFDGFQGILLGLVGVDDDFAVLALVGIGHPGSGRAFVIDGVLYKVQHDGTYTGGRFAIFLGIAGEAIGKMFQVAFLSVDC